MEVCSFLDIFAVFRSYFLQEYLFSVKVVEVKSNGMVSTRKINRRHLLKSSGGYFFDFALAKISILFLSCLLLYKYAPINIDIELLRGRLRTGINL